MTTASADAPLKGLAVLLRAIASLRSSYPDIRLTLVGRPKPGGDTEKLIASLGLGDVVESCKGISHEEMVQIRECLGCRGALYLRGIWFASR